MVEINHSLNLTSRESCHLKFIFFKIVFFKYPVQQYTKGKTEKPMFL